MKSPLIAPPALTAPAPRQPSFGSVAAKAQALAPGCQNPNGPALWAFAGAGLRILGTPATRHRSQEAETAAYEEARQKGKAKGARKAGTKSGQA